MRTIALKRGEERRVRAGHPWIFNNEIRGSLKDYEPGEIVRVFAAGGYQLGIGYVNPRTTIAVRLLATGRGELEPDFIGSRLAAALEMRVALFPESDVYRVAYGESDGLPGLIVDRYGPAVAVQTLTAGMMRLKDEILQAVLETLRPEVVVMRNDSRYRELEGLPLEVAVPYGTWSGPVRVRVAGLELLADLMEGQKTGLFLDQRVNLRALEPWSAGARVLDCFCYEGAWGLKALLCGAQSVVAVDTSSRALAAARDNAVANRCDGRWEPVEGDAFEVLDELKARAPFDLAVLDPPAFVRRKDRIASARRRYREVNIKAMKLLAPGGILVSCSCSYHLDRAAFRQVLSEAAAGARRRALILEERGQSPDHPVLLAARETEYLKCFVLRVL